MTVVHTFNGYGTSPYGSIPYGAGTALANSGLQFESVIVDLTHGEGIQFEPDQSDTLNPEGVQFESLIDDSLEEGVQFESLIADFLNEEGVQFESLVVDFLNNQGVQFDTLQSDVLKPQGIQFEPDQSDTLGPAGVQFDTFETDFLGPQGIQFFATNLGFTCIGYGQFPYGSRPYGQPECYASGGVQFDTIGDLEDPIGMQFESLIVDFINNQGIQFESSIVDFLNAQGVQMDSIEVDFLNSQGVQYSGLIVNKLNNQGLQFEAVITDFLNPEGVQFDAIAVTPSGIQFTVNLYNTTQLRVLCEFPSRGDDDAVGLNAWGRTSGTGNNWIANSQAAGDFEDFRLNTDIVEEVWRSAGAVTGVTLDCDAEVSQGIFLDTLAILNHNFSSSAIVTLIGSNSSVFAPIGSTTVLATRLDNIYHVQEDLPLVSFRYWRIQINDPTNTAGYLEVGTIVFGAAQIFQGECMIDRILKRTRHFADSVRTEGFTSVKNDRSVKNAVTLTFEKLEFNKGNFQTLDNVIQTARTSQKCLWIPTPSPTDPSFNERFAVFAKLSEMPQQSHQVMGVNEGDYIDLTLELDESE